jgi:hypothetical protein
MSAPFIAVISFQDFIYDFSLTSEADNVQCLERLEGENGDQWIAVRIHPNRNFKSAAR